LLIDFSCKICVPFMLQRKPSHGNNSWLRMTHNKLSSVCKKSCVAHSLVPQRR
jgi:hypothetical protein